MNNQESYDILLVEDNAQDAEMVRWALKKEKLADKLMVVNDGAEAIDFLFAQGSYAHRDVDKTPKVIFLDLKLPRLDGLEVLRKIKADEKTRKIPVVMLTSSHEHRDVITSYKLGVNSYVVKPVKAESFDKSVREMGTYWLSINHVPA
jgi:two-component system response regulator